MPERPTNSKRKIREAVVMLFAGIAAAAVFYVDDLSITASSQTARRRTAQQTSRYSSFPHDIKAHNLECGSCHKFPSPNWNTVRTGDAAFPDITEYPRHESCLNCHRRQFFRGTPPAVCSICHVRPSPRDGRRHPFPNPREIFDQSAKGKSATSDFVVYFPHATHVDIVSALRPVGTRLQNVSFAAGRRAEESCAVCHQTMQPQGDSDVEFVTKPPADLGDAFWLKKGTFKTSPIGHTTCFTCHSAESGIEPAPSNCGACHKIKPPDVPADFDPRLAARMGITDKVMLAAWRRRDSSGTYRHEWFSHAELSCAACHNVTDMNTTDARTKKVPVSACAACHATATLDDGGALNYEIDQRKTKPTFQCVKCHVIFGSRPVPESHLNALAAAAGK